MATTQQVDRLGMWKSGMACQQLKIAQNPS